MSRRSIIKRAKIRRMQPEEILSRQLRTLYSRLVYDENISISRTVVDMSIQVSGGWSFEQDHDGYFSIVDSDGKRFKIERPA